MTPRVALVVISDRGDRYLPRCLDSLPDFPWCQQVIVEDPLHEYDQNEVISYAWSQVGDAEFAFHCEEDFVLHDAPMADMVRVLDENPDLANLVLKRQPWSDVEVRAGGIIECFPDSYEDREGFVGHRRFFSLNPCIIPRHVVNMGWAGSEGDMTDRCIEAGLWFGFYGKRHDAPRVTHIGDVKGCASFS